MNHEDMKQVEWLIKYLSDGEVNLTVDDILLLDKLFKRVQELEDENLFLMKQNQANLKKVEAFNDEKILLRREMRSIKQSFTQRMDNALEVSLKI